MATSSSKIKAKVTSAAKAVSSAVKSAVNSSGKSSQSASVYSSVKSQTPVTAKQLTTKTQKAPQYTPVTGSGTKSNGYTYTPTGWQPSSTAVLSSPAPKQSIGKPSTVAQNQSIGSATSGMSSLSRNSAGSSQTPNMSVGASTFGGLLGSPSVNTTLGTVKTSVPKTSTIGGTALLSNNNPEVFIPKKEVVDYSKDIPTVAPVVAGQTTEETLRLEREKNQKDYLAGILDSFNEKETGQSIDEKLQRELGIKQKQEDVNTYTGQLNAIVAKGEANQLSLVGQGRGIPEAIIGGQQAQIARETAISALPVQAQLSAAQGNLEMANDSLDRLFKIYSEDANNKYNYDREVRKAVYDFASSEDKRKLDAFDRQKERELKEQDMMLADAKEYAKMAFSNNQSSLGAKITQLDYKSPTFRQDLAKLQAQLKDPVQQAQLTKLNAEIAQLNNKGQTVNGVNEDLTAYASQYADTGKLPSPAELKMSGLSVGQVTSFAKQIPRSKGFVVSNTTGTKSNSISAEAEKDFQKLYNVVEMTKRLKELDKKRVGGVVSGLAGAVFGSEDQGEYLTLRKAIVDEMSRMQSGAALTPDEIAVYNDYLPGRYSESFFLGQDSLKKINNFETTMNQKLENRLANNGLSIYGYSQVPVGKVMRTVGEIVDVGGVNYRVLPDGSLTDIL